MKDWLVDAVQQLQCSRSGTQPLCLPSRLVMLMLCCLDVTACLQESSERGRTGMNWRARRCLSSERRMMSSHWTRCGIIKYYTVLHFFKEKSPCRSFIYWKLYWAPFIASQSHLLSEINRHHQHLIRLLALYHNLVSSNQMIWVVFQPSYDHLIHSLLFPSRWVSWRRTCRRSVQV